MYNLMRYFELLLGLLQLSILKVHLVQDILLILDRRVLLCIVRLVLVRGLNVMFPIYLIVGRLGCNVLF
jgi:hypothetical protein